MNKFWTVYEPYYGIVGGDKIVLTDLDGDPVVKGYSTFDEAVAYAKKRYAERHRTCFILNGVAVIDHPILEANVTHLLDGPLTPVNDNTDTIAIDAPEMMAA